MVYQGKPRRITRAAALGAVIAVTSTLSANAFDAGSLLAPILTPVTGGAAPVTSFGAPAGGYAAFATGTVLHAGVAGSLGATLDLVSSTAAASSAPVASAVNSELGRAALPVLPAKGSYAQGIGLGVGLGLLPGVSTGLFGNATATAPPSSAPVEQESAPSSGAPVANVAPLRARAQALSSANGCVLGSNLAFGRGDAADVSLAGLVGLAGVVIGNPGAATHPLSSSESRTVIVPGSAAGRLGLMGETSQLLGPITLLAGTAGQTTVEVKGQWLLRVTADGRTGAVGYGPQGLAGDQAVVVVRNAAGAVVAQASASEQKLAGSAGLHLDIPGVGEIVVGEQPRARGRAGAAQASGTAADAAVDLVRIRLLGQDVRIGHMEAAVAVPAAGVTCPGLEVTITPDATTVAPGGRFDARFRVRNPNEGTARGVTIVPRLGSDPGVDFGYEVATIGAGSTPEAAAADAERQAATAFQFTTAPLAPGQTAEFPVHLHVLANSGPGATRLGATATGVYGDGPQAVPTAGDLTVEGPRVTLGALNAPGGPAIKNPAGGKVAATAGASSPAGSGGRKPGRASAGITGAAGSAASAAPVAPAPTTPVPAPTPPTPPATEPPPVAVTAPTQASPTPAERAAPALKGKPARHQRRPWVGAASVLLLAVATAVAVRLAASGRR
ncbi:MAG TPA: hypothetical protein VGQ80_14260 [Acidimicrobiia bacterium]|nr:hypothetical protein [Acidimicrobiia bacterium]